MYVITKGILVFLMTSYELPSDNFSPCVPVSGCPRKATPAADKFVRCDFDRSP